MTVAVSIDGLHKQFGDLTALNGVSFEIQQGEFFGLLGPNGAGKSTLINILAGLAHANSGAVQVLGHDVVRDYRNARRKLGVVPQELAYDPFFTVREVLELQSGYFGLAKTNAAWLDELLAELDLTDKADANMRQLSGGMKRRVLIAQALVHRPPVVVLDEPTAGVDVELRRTLWRFVRKLHGEGHTIVLTTHYLEEAESLCERIAILNHGEVQALDEKQALLNRYPYRELQLQLASDAPLPKAVADVMTQRNGANIILKLHRERDSITAMLDALRNAGVEIADIRTKEPDLETVFLNLTQKK